MAIRLLSSESISGSLTVSGAGTIGGSLTVTGAGTIGGALSAGTTTITSDSGLFVYTTTSLVGAKTTFSDESSSQSQKGFITYFHQDTASYGSGNSFVINGDQATMTILADGKLMYKEGVYLKPATGTGAGTRKDNLWDTAYNDSITALSVTGTTTKTLTATQEDGGTLTVSWTDTNPGGPFLPLAGGTMAGTIDMNNNALLNAGEITFNDPGVNEGIKWNNGNLWQIYESPNDQTNLAGNLQFVQNTTRRMTIDTGGNVEIVSGSLGIGTASPSDWGWIIDQAIQFKNGAFVAGRTDATSALNFGANAFVTATGGNEWKYFAAGKASRYFTQTGAHYFQIASAGAAAGDTITWTSALEILNDGKVGIGENSPADKLDVNGAILCNNRVQIDGLDDGGNVTGSLDSLRATGYGLMANRTGNVYITNGNSATGAQLVFGLRAAHNGNNKLVIGDTVSYFNNNVVLINKTVNHGGQLQVGTTATSGSIRIGGGNGAGESRVYIESNGNSSYIDSFGGAAYQDFKIQAAVLSFQTSGSTTRSVDMGTATWRGYGSNPVAKLNIEVAGGNALNIFNTSEDNAYLNFIDSQSNGSQYANLAFHSSTNIFTINNMGYVTTINTTGGWAFPSTINTTGNATIGGMLDISGSRSTYVTNAEDDSATSHIFTTDSLVGDFGQLAGSLVLQARVNDAIYRDIILAGGLGTTANPVAPILTVRGEAAVQVDGSFTVNGGSTFDNIITINIDDISTGENRGVRIINEQGVDQQWNITVGVTGEENDTFCIRNATDNINALKINRGGDTLIHDDIFVGSNGFFGDLTDAATRKVRVQTAALQDSLIELREDTDNYGFTLGYYGVANTFQIKRHDNSAAGVTVLTIPRSTGSVTFASTITTIGATINGTLSANGTIACNNTQITGVNHIEINDPGPTEGINWNGGNLWRIVECPDNMTTNGAGNLQFSKNGVRSVTVTTGGALSATGDVIAYSDRRVKENIKTIDNALDKVTKLRGVSYNRTDSEDTTDKIGVIAQEVIDVLPEVVTYGESDDRYSVSYGNMAGIFIEAIKELKAEIEELKKHKCNCKE